jgi:hypothetical protein
VNNASEFKLGDIKATGTVYQEDSIQFIDPVTSVIDPTKVYTYYGVSDGAVEGEDDGWYTFDPTGAIEERYANEDTFPAGTAFLANFYTSHNPTLTCAGQVMIGDVVIDTKVGDNYVAYMYIANPFPSDITLGSIVPTGTVYQEDTIQFINPNTSVIDPEKVYTYYGVSDGAIAGEDDGWYTFDPNGVMEERFANGDTLKTGDGFLCNCYTSHKVKFTFKAVVSK